MSQLLATGNPRGSGGSGALTLSEPRPDQLAGARQLLSQVRRGDVIQMELETLSPPRALFGASRSLECNGLKVSRVQSHAVKEVLSDRWPLS